MKKRYYTQRSIYHGSNYIDVQMFPSFSLTKRVKTRRKKTKPTRQMQKVLNENMRINKLVRLVNNNFGENDIAVHITYQDRFVPKNAEEAKADIQNYLRRLKRKYQKCEIEFKYIWTAAKGERSGRVHFHLIISGGVARDELERLWGKGYAHVSKLRFNQDGAVGLGKYFCGQDKLLYRTWSASKNLKHPEIDDKRTTAQEVYDIYDEYQNNYSFCELEKQYPGYGVSYIQAAINEMCGGVYILARLYKKTEVKADFVQQERLE